MDISVRWGFCVGCVHDRWLILKGERWAGCRESFESAKEFADRLASIEEGK